MTAKIVPFRPAAAGTPIRHRPAPEASSRPPTRRRGVGATLGQPVVTRLRLRRPGPAKVPHTRDLPPCA